MGGLVAALVEVRAEPLRKVFRFHADEFEGDDQLCQINEGIREITGENLQLRKRIKGLREALTQRTDK